MAKASYIGAPACFSLELALQHLCKAFNVGACYQVGSSLERPDWRDVDIRMILSDDEFENLFPDAEMVTAAWEMNPRWLVLTVAISQWLSNMTGLPVDFQFQPQSYANKRYSGPRNAKGIVLIAGGKGGEV